MNDDQFVVPDENKNIRQRLRKVIVSQTVTSNSYPTNPAPGALNTTVQTRPLMQLTFKVEIE